jgi:prophage regulatory protein
MVRGESMNNQSVDILIKLSEVCRQAGFARSTIYGLISTGSFPAPTKLGRYSRWSQQEIQLWIVNKKKERIRA